MEFRRSKLYSKKPWANPERNETFTKKKRKLGRVVSNESLLEKSESSRSPWLGSVG